MADTVTCPVGSVIFTSQPAGAEVFMDGMDQGIPASALITDVPAGVHTYTLKLAGYNDYTGTVNILESQTAGVTANLITASNKGLLAVLSLMGLGVLGAVMAASREEIPKFKYDGERYKCVLKPVAQGR